MEPGGEDGTNNDDSSGKRIADACDRPEDTARLRRGLFAALRRHRRTRVPPMGGLPLRRSGRERASGCRFAYEGFRGPSDDRIQPADRRVRGRRLAGGGRQAVAAGHGDPDGRVWRHQPDGVDDLPPAFRQFTLAQRGDAAERRPAQRRDGRARSPDAPVHRVRVHRPGQELPPVLDRDDPARVGRRRLGGRAGPATSRRDCRRRGSASWSARTSTRLCCGCWCSPSSSCERTGNRPDHRQRCGGTRSAEEGHRLHGQSAQGRRHLHGGAQVPGRPRVIR